MLPFTQEQFFAIFAAYNAGVWPVQLLAYAAAVPMVAAVIRPFAMSGPLVATGLAAMWSWTGIVYHGL